MLSTYRMTSTERAADIERSHREERVVCMHGSETESLAICTEKSL